MFRRPSQPCLPRRVRLAFPRSDLRFDQKKEKVFIDFILRRIGKIGFREKDIYLGNRRIDFSFRTREFLYTYEFYLSCNESRGLFCFGRRELIFCSRGKVFGE